MRPRRGLAYLPVVVLCLAAAQLGWTAQLPERAKVLSVTDGDTIKVEAEGSTHTVRLIGVDTPEVHPSSKLDRDAERAGRDRDAIVALGKRASAFTAKLLPKGTAVRLEYDKANAASGHRDKYGRLLAFVWKLGGEAAPVLVNAEIIRQGYGNAMTRYPYDKKRQGLFLKLQREARQQRRGLWGQDAEAEPKGTGSVVDSKRSDKYHRPDCRWAKMISAANLVTFKSAAEAKAAGYAPCKTCRPPEYSGLHCAPSDALPTCAGPGTTCSSPSQAPPQRQGPNALRRDCVQSERGATGAGERKRNVCIVLTDTEQGAILRSVAGWCV